MPRCTASIRLVPTRSRSTVVRLAPLFAGMACLLTPVDSSRAAVAYALPALEPARILAPPAQILPQRLPGAPEIAIVLDDMGHDIASIRRIAAWPIPLTAAFLPYVTDAPARVAIARAAGKEIFLHMPMQPENAAVDPGPLVLRIDQPKAEIRALLDQALARVPGSTGLNNHMGSLFTRMPEPMATVVDWAAARGLVLLDSRTTAESVAAALAAAAGLPHATRSVFLDHVDDPDAIRAQLARAEEQARRVGEAIAIGHPRAATLAVLEEWIPQALARGIHFTTVGEIARRRSCQESVADGTVDGGFSRCRPRSSRLLRPHG